MLKLRTKAQSCLSSPNHSLALQLAENEGANEKREHDNL
jgi:hypothetical protein